MKKLIVVLIALIPSLSSAQISKGAQLLEGNFSLTSSKSDDEFSTNYAQDSKQQNTFFAARPRFGFFLNETFLLGFGLSYEFRKITYETEYTFGQPIIYTSVQKRNMYFFNPYVQKYINLSDKLYLTLSGNLKIGLGDSSYEVNSNKTETEALEFEVSIAPGLTYFVSNKWALTANFGSLYYDHYKETLTTDVGVDEDPVNVDKNFGASFQFNTFSIGFQYYLNNKAN